MSDAYMDYRLGCYLHNLVKNSTRSARAANALVEYIEQNGPSFGVALAPEVGSTSSRRRRSFVRLGSISQETWHALGDAAAYLARPRGKPGMFDSNLAELGDALGLDQIERDLLRLTMACTLDIWLQRLVDLLFPNIYRAHNLPELLARMLDCSRAAISSRLRPDSSLMQSGVLHYQPSEAGFNHTFGIARRLVEALLSGNGLQKVRTSFFGPPTLPSLKWEDFEHLGAERDLAANILAGAIQTGHAGVNILLYGLPGTGKTEFAKSVAARLGATQFAIGEANGHGEEPDRADRLFMLELGHRLLRGAAPTLLLFDEAEDLFQRQFFDGSRASSRWKPTGSRVFMHRLLETNALPVLWTCNDISGFEPSLLRRMTMAIEVKVPPARVRHRIWSRTLENSDITLPDSTLQALAREFEIAPALSAGAVQAARLARGDQDAVRMALRGIDRAMRGGHDAPSRLELDGFYDASLANADCDLLHLAERLAASNSRRFSLCLYGPSGTGKSAWARHLADTLGMDVIQKRPSDLSSMWRGESEKAIAAAFAEAAARNALLIFDEVDSFLQDRRHADRAWEVAEANEFLTSMETHPLPLVCTTNLMDRIDSAAMRRFTFKVKFDYLRPQQNNAAFKVFFDMEAPVALSMLHALTPGDYALVRRKVELLVQQGPDTLCAMLEAETRSKPGVVRAMGFGR